MLSPNTYLFPYFLSIVLLLIVYGIVAARYQKSSVVQVSGYALIALPIIYFFYIISSHAVNIPFTDDYELLKTFYELIYVPEPIEKAKALFEQVNQHRFAFERMLMLGIYQVAGSENIKMQIAVGNLFMLGVLYLFYKFWKSENFSLTSFLPVPFLLFNLVYYENALWGIAAMQNTALIFIALLAVYGLSITSKKGYYVALACAAVISFVSGSGLSIWLIGVIILALQKQFKRVVIWVIGAVLVGSFYFLFDYEYFKGDNEALFNHLLYNLIYAFGFLGNSFFMDKPHPYPSGLHIDVILCVLVGAALVGIFILFIIRLFNQLLSSSVRWTYWFLLGAMLFFLATGAMLVLSRPVSHNIIYGGEIYSRRYMIFGIGFLTCGYLATLLLLKNYQFFSRIYIVFSLAIAVTLNLTSYYISLQQVRAHRENLLVDTYYWPTHQMLLTTGEDYGQKFFWNHPTMMTNLVRNLDQGGLYQYPEHPLTPVKPGLASVPVQDRLAKKGIMDIKSEPKPGWAGMVKNRVTLNYELPDEPAEELKYVALRSDKHLFLLPTVPKRKPFLDFVKTGSYYSQKYTNSFWGTKFLTGTYEIWLLYIDKSGNWSRTPTGQTLNL